MRLESQTFLFVHLIPTWILYDLMMIGWGYRCRRINAVFSSNWNQIARRNGPKKTPCFSGFRTIGYAASIFLVFGESIERFRDLARNELGLVDLELVDLYHHPHPGAAAQIVDW